MFDVIVSFDKKTFGIGLDNQLPWCFKKDLQWFYTITTSKNDKDCYDNILIVGIKTLLSLPANLNFKNRKLVVVLNKNRDTTILDTIPLNIKKHILFTSSNFDEAYYKSMVLKHNRLFVIGGASLYKDALKNNHLRYLYIGLFDFPCLECNKYFPLSSLRHLKLIDLLERETVYTIQMNEDTIEVSYSFAKYVLITPRSILLFKN